MSREETNLTTARRYLAALAAGETGARIAAFFDPSVVQIEHPNRLKPNGDRRELSALGADAKRGVKLLARQSYEIEQAVADGDRLALQVVWEGVLAAQVANLAPGDTMRAHSAIFLEFRDGRILRQANYDCFDAF